MPLLGGNFANGILLAPAWSKSGFNIKCYWPKNGDLGQNNLTLAANTYYLSALRIDHDLLTDALLWQVAGFAASTSTLIGIYKMNDDGTIGSLVIGPLTMDTSSSGEKIMTFTQMTLPRGWYYIQWISASTAAAPRMMAQNLDSPFGWINQSRLGTLMTSSTFSGFTGLRGATMLASDTVTFASSGIPNCAFRI